ncbi:MAG: hypothetical protein ACR652_04640 [Methylocystis sp.]|uniref:hypothetical protein n=1 Tax=Methylocystis sp. TaxID=1911079 RepID=UPI003DA57527
MSFQDARSIGSSVNSVTRSASIGDKQKAERNSNANSLIIFTEPNESAHSDFATSVVSRCAANGLSAEHVMVPGSELLQKIAALHQEGKIGDGTQIIINMHGSIGARHELHDSVATCDVVEAVRKSPNGKACAANVYIASCNAGDAELRKQLQELHNQRPVGACFLLSGKKKVIESAYHNEINAMCDELAYTNLSSGQPPSPHLILARMATYQSDCITMIVPNMDPTIRHAPKDESQFGLGGLMRDIESRLASREGPSDPSSEAASQVKEENKISQTGEKPLDAKKSRNYPPVKLR